MNIKNAFKKLLRIPGSGVRLLRAALSAVASWIESQLIDILGLVGLSMIWVGVDQIFGRSWAFLVVGTVIFCLALGAAVWRSQHAN